MKKYLMGLMVMVAMVTIVSCQKGVKAPEQGLEAEGAAVVPEGEGGPPGPQVNLPSEENVVVEGEVEIASKENKVTISAGDKPVVTIEVTGDIDLGKVTVQKQGSKVVVTNVENMDHYLYIDDTYGTGTYVCPQATTLSQVFKGCPGEISFTDEQCKDPSVVECQYVDGQYMVKVSGSGGDQNPPKLGEGLTLYVGSHGPDGTVYKTIDGKDWTDIGSGELKEHFISIYGLWGTSPENIYAAGTLFVFRYDGEDWKVSYFENMLHPDGIYGNKDDENITHFTGIWGTDANNIYAVAADEKTITHYDGEEWSIVYSAEKKPSLPESIRLKSIWGADKNNIFAVGYNGAILHYNGTGWTVMVEPVKENLDLNSVWGAAANDVYAVGMNELIRHYDGAGWTTVVPPPHPYLGTCVSDLKAVGGTSGNDIYAVGDCGTNPHTVFHYDGDSWKDINWTELDLSGFHYIKYRAIWGNAPDNIFIAGTTAANQAVVIHYNGTEWKLLKTGYSAILDSMWATY